MTGTIAQFFSTIDVNAHPLLLDVANTRYHATTDDSYDVPVDPKQQDKATTIKLCSIRRPHMRAFHFAWFGFFMAFVSWFAFAPLMPEIKVDLGMSQDEVYNANISSVSSTVLSRFIVGPLCDTFGARVISSTLLLMGCIPTFFAGLVQNAVDVAVIRFFIGVMGATFVCTQYWSSQVFAKEFVGTANATTAGWGNLGGGVTQVRLFRSCEHLDVIYFPSPTFGAVDPVTARVGQPAAESESIFTRKKCP